VVSALCKKQCGCGGLANLAQLLAACDVPLEVETNKNSCMSGSAVDVGSGCVLSLHHQIAVIVVSKLSRQQLTWLSSN
jgi:hypothetical protein